MNARRIQFSRQFACVVAAVVGVGAISAGQTPDCKNLPPREEGPDEIVAKAWLSSKAPLSVDVALTRSEPGKVTETLAEGRVEIATDGTLHYHVGRTIRKHAPGEPSGAPGRLLKPDAEFWVRGPVVVLVDPVRGATRWKLDDVAPKVDEKTDPAKARGPSAQLLAALGGDEELARARAELMRWTASLGDPRRCRAADEDIDLTSFSGSSSPIVTTNLPIPKKQVAQVLPVVSISVASVALQWTQQGGVCTAKLCLHTTASRKLPEQENYFDLVVEYEKPSDQELPPPPAEVQALLTPEPAGK